MISRVIEKGKKKFQEDYKFLLGLIIISFFLHLARMFIVFSTLGYGGVGWGYYPHDALSDLASVWDGWFYLGIAQNGYYIPEFVGFPPFYPFCIRILSLIFPFKESMLLINSFCLIVATPILAYLASSELFQEKTKIKLCTIVVTLNPFIVAWGTIGLSEPLGYVLCLALVYCYLKENYTISCFLYSIGILTRFSFVVAGGLFLYDFIFKRKFKNIFPLLAGGITYIGWNWYTKITYGLMNTDVRSIYWHHYPGIKWGDISVYAQLSYFVVTALLLLVMWTYYKKNEDKIAALLAWGVAGYLLISIFPVYGYGQLRYVGFILPIFLLLEGFEFEEWKSKIIMYLSASWVIITIVVAPQFYQSYIGALDKYPYIYMADIALILIGGALITQYLIYNSKHYTYIKRSIIVGIAFALAGLCLSFTVVRIF
ncbi:hypothetical protein ACFLY8_00180 [Halobacteriota archaeon]